MTFGARVWRMAAVLVLLVSLPAATSVGAQRSERFTGLSLAEALQRLQAMGLRIVFTSATVTPELRVGREPRARTARQQLDELLAPHGLQARDGPGGIIEVVRAPVRTNKASPPAAGTTDRRPERRAAPSGPATHREHVTVGPPAHGRDDRGVPSETSIDRSELQRLHGTLADDPLRVVHAFPRVSAIDDVHGEFAVRGSPFRHVDLVIDGVSTHWLQHTAHRRGATGTIGMIAGDVLESATLRAGAFPRRNSDRLGAELELTLREGSRTRTGLRGTLGGTNATIVGEGPVGPNARGSWLIALRQSYLEWPAEAEKSTRAAFGFSDAVAKLVYDVHPRHQLGFSAIGGLSNVDTDDNPDPHEPGAGRSGTTIVNLAWRSTFGRSLLLNQRAHIVRQSFVNKHQSGEDRDRGLSEEMVYRADVLRPIAGGLLEAGARVARTDIRDVPNAREPFAGSSWQRSGYAHFVWSVTPAITLSPGMRVTASTLLPRPVVARWLLGEWTFNPAWTLIASAGASRQLPELRHMPGGVLQLRPERAMHFDLGVEQRISESLRWQTTVFNREEANVLREPDLYPRLVGETIVPPDGRYVNAIRGSARGIELLVERRSATGLSGWAAYSYGLSRQTDTERDEQFWSDFDRRHSLSLFAVYRFPHRTAVGATFRGASSVPLPGYLEARDGALFISGYRNRVRLPVYARLDLRADREFKYFGRRLTLFGEALNVLNRGNPGITDGSIDPSSGEARGFIDRPFRRRLSAGIIVEF